MEGTNNSNGMDATNFVTLGNMQPLDLGQSTSSALAPQSQNTGNIFIGILSNDPNEIFRKEIQTFLNDDLDIKAISKSMDVQNDFLTEYQQNMLVHRLIVFAMDKCADNGRNVKMKRVWNLNLESNLIFNQLVSMSFTSAVGETRF